MSLGALLEIVIHLEQFRNIDLFYQGLYYLKVKIYHLKNEQVNRSFGISALITNIIHCLINIYLEGLRNALLLFYFSSLAREDQRFEERSTGL